VNGLRGFGSTANISIDYAGSILHVLILGYFSCIEQSYVRIFCIVSYECSRNKALVLSRPFHFISFHFPAHMSMSPPAILPGTLCPMRMTCPNCLFAVATASPLPMSESNQPLIGSFMADSAHDNPMQRPSRIRAMLSWRDPEIRIINELFWSTNILFPDWLEYCKSKIWPSHVQVHPNKPMFLTNPIPALPVIAVNCLLRVVPGTLTEQKLLKVMRPFSTNSKHDQINVHMVALKL